MDVMSGIQSCDVIKSGCDVTSNSYDTIHIVDLRKHILQMCYIQYTVSKRSQTVDVMTGILGVMTSIKCV